MNKAQAFELSLFRKLGVLIEADDPLWSDAREIIITGGWRAGKSMRSAMRVMRQVLRPNSEEGLIWLVGPDYHQASEEFRYILEWSMQLGLGDTSRKAWFTNPSQGQKTMHLKTGWRIETKSAKHPERMASVAPDGIVLCEPGQMNGEVYVMSLGRLLQKGGWLWAAGTLESNNKVQWIWYELLASEWSHHQDGDDQRSFSLPSWANRKEFPGGREDPKILDFEQRFSEYTFKRRIAGEPVGVENPCFPELWEVGSEGKYIVDLEARIKDGLRFIDGAIGVDYGGSDDHPSCAVAISVDMIGQYWIREMWADVGGNPDKIVAGVESLKRKYGITKVRTDPREPVLASLLNGVSALAGPQSTDIRIGVTRGIVEDYRLFFDSNGKGVSANENPQIPTVFNSMRAMRRKPNTRGMLTYDRDLGDDPAQAVNYAMEELKGEFIIIPEVERLGNMKFSYELLPSRAAMVGRA